MRSLLGVGLLLVGLLPLRAGAQEIHLSETYTSPNGENKGYFGSAIAEVEDISGDGLPDFLVGSPNESDWGTEAGRAYLIDGATGQVLQTLSSANPEKLGNFGRVVSGVGDVNGDGTSDLLVGAPSESPGDVNEAGRAYLIDGATGEAFRALTSPNSEKLGSYGAAVSGCGDVNGDGTPDLLVGAPNESHGGIDEAGRVYLIDGANGEVLHTITSPNPKEFGDFGRPISEIGDVNGDSTPDLLIGQHESSRAYLIDGTTGEVLQTLTSPSSKYGEYGRVLSGVRDVNGDGTPDLLVGAPSESPGNVDEAGRVYLIDGADGKMLRTLTSPNAENSGSFGSAVAGIWDVSGDGVPDLLVGARNESSSGKEEAGRAYLIDGANGEVLKTLSSPNGNKLGDFGAVVSGLGNVKEDGTLDLLVGAPFEKSDGSPSAGRIYQFNVKRVPLEKAADRLLDERHPQLVEPKGEFETTEAYRKRQQRAKAKKKEILKELRQQRKQRIQKSLTSITLSIQEVGTYNADQEIFPIKIQDTTYEVEIPLDEARSFDENWQDAKVVGYKQLKEDLSGYRPFNLKIVHPVTGSRYPVGPQEEIDRKPVADQKQVDPDALPSTTASVTFTEPSGNDRLDGAETASVQVTVKNEGNGPARQVQANVRPSSHPHLTYPTAVSFGTVKADTSATERIEIQADRTISSRSVDLTFQFEEANGFAPSPVKLQFETQEFIPPELTVADVGINDSNGNGIIEPGELVKVTARIKNESRGRAIGVSAQVNFGENVFATPKTKQAFDLGTLGLGEHQDVKFSLVTNQQAESVPVTVDLTEKYGEFGKQGVKLPLAFDQPTDQITEVQVEGQETEVAVQSGEALSVDVETNIPTTPMDRPDAVAVVMGVRSYSSEGVPNVEYARRDARIMREYLTQTLGFREENTLPRNPDGRMTYAEMRTLIQQKLPSYVKEDSEVFVFYSGHGAPTTGENRQGYLVPSDTDPNFVSDANAYALKDFYTDLSEIGAESVTVVLDACFTGQSGSGEMMIKKASPSVLSVENPFLAIENGTAFLASSTEQVANWYPSKKHGMFTYFFLKGLKGAANQNGDRQLTVAEMEAYLTDADDGVPYYSRRVHQRKQTPQIVAQDKERVLVRYEE